MEINSSITTWKSYYREYPKHKDINILGERIYLGNTNRHNIKKIYFIY